jgi:replication factor C large subunit
MSTARRDVMPYLATMTHHCKNRELTVAMTARYDLDAEHVSFVTGSGKDTNKVQSIVADAEELREEAAVEHSGGAFEGGRASSTESEGAGEDAGDDTDGDENEGDDDEGDGQATLTASAQNDGDDEDGDGDERAADADAAEDDEQQSGLGDFM